MTTWTDILNASLGVDKAVKTSLMISIRDNDIAGLEGSSGAPVNAAGWHPYDMVDVGDGNDGVIYDFAVDGLVTSVTTPDFADGWEYRFVGLGVSHDSGLGSRSFDFACYKATAAAYTTARAVSPSVNNASSSLFDFVVPMPRLSKTHFRWHGGGHGLTGGAATVYDWIEYDSTAQKILRGQFTLSASGNMDAGQIIMLRRRCFQTAT